jgi:uncharacterized membrane protein YkvI
LKQNSYLTRVVLTPSAVFLSVIFGGAYGSGREVVEFISRHGPVGGYIAIGTIALVFLVCLFLVFEIGRMFQQFDYRGFSGVLLGPIRHFYDVIIFIGLLVALAFCAAAAGGISASHFGLPEMVGGIALLLIIVTLTYLGRTIVEKSMIWSISALGLILVYLLFTVLSDHGADIGAAFRMEPVVTDGIATGFKYGMTNCGYLPILLYCARDLANRKETFTAAGFAAVAGVIPAIAFHFSFMVAYPQIIAQQVPTYWVLNQVTSPMFLNIYVTVVFVLIAQTGVGLLQGVLESIDIIKTKRTGLPLPPAGHALVAGGAVVASSLLASIGLINLIVRGYSFMFMAFVVIFYLPLMTRGIYLIFWKRPE